MPMEKKAHHLVGHVAQRMERGTVPAIDDIAEDGVSSFPELAFHFLDLLVEYYLPDSENEVSDSHYEAALALFEDCLLKLRFATERNRSWAPEMVEKLQDHIAACIFVPEVGHLLQQDVLEAFKDAGLEILPAIKNANHRLLEYYNRFGFNQEIPDIQDLISGLEEEGVVDVYDIAELFLPQLRLLPDEEDQLRILGFLASSPSEKMREVVGLTLLHPDPDVRVHIPGIIKSNAEAGLVSPITLSRMITVRNWLPEKERPFLDQAIKAVRKARIMCQPLERAELLSLSSSCLDGAGTMAIWLFAKHQDSYISTHILGRMGLGIREVWFRVLDDKSKMESMSGPPDKDLPHFPVTETYLHGMISHFLADGHRNNSAPPVELLRIAEILGGGRWGATPLDEHLVRGDDDLEDKNSELDLVADSHIWAMENGLARSWFEDDEEVESVLEEATAEFEVTESPEVLEKAILYKVLEPRRKQWFQRFLVTAWWLKGVDPSPNPTWRNFLKLALRIQDGLPFDQIPIMSRVASQTLYATMLRLSKMAIESLDENDESFIPGLNELHFPEQDD